MRKLWLIVVTTLFFLVPQARAQDGFSASLSLTSTFAGIGLGVDVDLGTPYEVTRFGVWVNIPSAALQTRNFGVGGKVELLYYDLWSFIGLGLFRHGDLIAPYSGLYGTLGVGGNAGFFLGVGAVLGLEVNPIPNFLGIYAEIGLGIGIPYIVDAQFSAGVRIYFGNVF
jgi:hypothetical protein